MTTGTVFAPPTAAFSVHDPDNPMYRFQTDTWEETPDPFPCECEQTEFNDLRESNNKKYRDIGDCELWNQYIAFGFHQFDDCFSFEAQWKKVSRIEDPMEKYKLIWTEYTTYLLNKEEPTNSQLYAWTHNLALPYISKHEHHFHLASVYNIEDTIGEQLPREITHPLQTTWTVIGPKKKKSPPPSPVPAKNFQETTLNIDNTNTTLELRNINHPKQWKLVETATKKKRTHSQTTNESPNRNRNKPNKTTQQSLAHMTNALTLISKHMRRGTSKLMPPHTLKGTPPRENANLIDPDKISDNAQSIDENSFPPQADLVEPMRIDAEDSHLAHTQPTTNNTPTGVLTAEPTSTSTPVYNPYATPTPNKDTIRNDNKAIHHDGRGNASRNDVSQGTKTSNEYSLLDGQSMQSTMYTKTTPFIPVNDGSYRITLKWAASNFDELKNNTDEWNQQTVYLIKQLFESSMSPVTLIPWEATNLNNPIQVQQLTTATLSTYRSPKVTAINSSSQFIYGIRVCMGTQSPGSWITQEATKNAMTTNQVTINVSNSKCSSGDIVLAGHILLKHPEWTQRTFYLMSLRRTLPDTTPYFDIGIQYKTPHGERVPHLVVRCGSNHVNTLTEILSAHIDGGEKSTALFLNHQLIKGMSQEESTAIFEQHTNFVKSLQRLPMYPLVINVDRLRRETTNGLNMERSARDWVATLRLANGTPMQCDVENGGTDRRAYMIAPTNNLENAKTALEHYKIRLKQGSNLFPNTQSNTGERENMDHRPLEIYVPTAAVMKNLQVIRNMTSAEIWKSAPSSIRNANDTPGNDSKSAHIDSAESNTKKILENNSTRQQQTGPKTTNSSQNAHNQSEQNRASKSSQAEDMLMDEATVATTNTPMSRMTATHQSTIAQFNELEAAIQSNQQDFQRVSNQMEQMDQRINRIMQANATTTSQINTLQAQIMQSSATSTQQFQIMQNQISQMLTQLATIVDQQTQLPANGFNDNMSIASQDSIPSQYTHQSRGSNSKNSTKTPSTKHSPEKKKPKSTHSECRDTTPNEPSTMETSSIGDNNTPTTHDDHNNQESDSDQSEAQYKYPPLPDGGDSE